MNNFLSICWMKNIISSFLIMHPPIYTYVSIKSIIYEGNILAWRKTPFYQPTFKVGNLVIALCFHSEIAIICEYQLFVDNWR